MTLPDIWDKVARLAQTSKVDPKIVRTGDVLLSGGEFYKVLCVLRKSRQADVIDQNGKQSVRALCEFEGRWSRDQARSLPLQWPV